jgi:glucan phosphoethanolaminetransferase (alkaline phosphatase superfamily)
MEARERSPGPLPNMLDLFAVAWVALSVVVLVFTRANRYLVLGTLGCTVLGFYFVASVWMNGALSVAVDEQSAQQHARAATTYELLTGVAMAAAMGCLVLAWRRRPRRAELQQSQGMSQRGTT